VIDPSREQLATTSKAEADASDALWRRLTVPEKERRKLLGTYRDAILHGAADRIRALGGCEPGGGFGGYDEGMEIAADYIDPGRTCDCGEAACECGCQQGERGRHWIHSRSCGTQKGSR
jgi:hypothetical protein